MSETVQMVQGYFEAVERDRLTFYDAEQAPFRIYGVTKENGYFRRMPEAAAAGVSQDVYGLHTNTAGGRVRFITDSPYVAIHVKMTEAQPGANSSLIGMAGMDLYAGEPGAMDFKGTFVPPEDSLAEFEYVVNLRGQKEQLVTIHFPSYNSLYEIQIGLITGSVLKEAPDYRYEKPFVTYGSSITQGGCASRPGNSYQNILSRRMDYNYWNLGFSGSAKGEPSMAEYIIGLDMSVFIMDYDHNAPTVEHLAATHEKMFRRIREARPELPVILMSRPRYSLTETDRQRLEIIRATYRHTVEAGDRNTWLIEGPELMKAVRDEGTVDWVHPNDAGFYSMAQAIEPVLRKALDSISERTR